MDKNKAFSYLISKFIQWHKELRPQDDFNKKFTKLFLLKMLFLVAAEKDENETDLLDVFDNFYALPYGPVESDIYNNMTSGNIPNYTITDRDLISLEETNLDLDEQDKEKLDKSLESLKKRNIKLITAGAFDLVNITHKWGCWDKAFKFAKFTGSGSTKMTTDLIRNDNVRYWGD